MQADTTEVRGIAQWTDVILPQGQVEGGLARSCGCSPGLSFNGGGKRDDEYFAHPFMLEYRAMGECNLFRGRIMACTCI